ncbi:type 1 glutamine amidotransferase domain-containing protein [Chitinimonas lacunae]|uniref:Type 1 glutamine amidotransferase domain-containing protein n=1 Tax=Chitinimonas lacunae TaxID=1963018 RepID=A0ABV8MJQ9_9NEIS
MNTATPLAHRRVAILVTDGFEESELLSPKAALEARGVTVDVVSDRPVQVQGFQHTEPGRQVTVDCALDQARADRYDALVLPGGVVNSDALRLLPQARSLAVAMAAAHKPIAVICHGAWLLVSAGLVADRTLTSWPSLQDDIRNAGGHWVDREVVCDGPLISSRRPDDLPAFNAALLNALARVEPT